MDFTEANQYLSVFVLSTYLVQHIILYDSELVLFYDKMQLKV